VLFYYLKIINSISLQCL